jgi:hypothetical protein
MPAPHGKALQCAAEDNSDNRDNCEDGVTDDYGMPHPSVFIKDEMDARGWCRDELAHRMGGDYRMQRLCIDMYFEVGPKQTSMRIGRGTADDLARAFDINSEFFRNLEVMWLKAQGVRV